MNMTQVMRKMARGLGAAAVALGAAGSAHAGYFTDQEAGLDAIFSQSSFGANKIDIRFSSVLNITSTAFATIDTDKEFDDLGRLGVAFPTVSLFFVDAINFCGIALPNIAGCAGVPGHTIIIASDVSGATGGQFGAFGPINVIGHELGHNLGLDHDDTTGNLLTSSLQENFGMLLPYQVATILGSTLVQTDNLGKFIQIQPYAVLAAVPEPETYAMLGLGLGVIAFIRRRKSLSA